MDDLRNQILEESHGSHYPIYPVSTKMYYDLRELFWWDTLKNDIAKFVAKFLNSQQMKAIHLKLSGILQEIQILTWKWEDFNIDFIVGLSRTRRKNDYIWAVVDIFIKFSHSIPVKSIYLTEDYAKIYNDVIVSLHGILLSMISDGDAQFTSRF